MRTFIGSKGTLTDLSEICWISSAWWLPGLQIRFCMPHEIILGSVASKIIDYSAANVTRDCVDEGQKWHSVGSAVRIRGRASSVQGARNSYRFRSAVLRARSVIANLFWQIRRSGAACDELIRVRAGTRVRLRGETDGDPPKPYQRTGSTVRGARNSIMNRRAIPDFG